MPHRICEKPYSKRETAASPEHFLTIAIIFGISHGGRPSWTGRSILISWRNVGTICVINGSILPD